MDLRNRLVMSPMETLYGTPEGHPSEQTVAYFEARAAGGVGLITVGATTVDHQHPETPGGLQLGTDESVEAHRRLVDVVHAHGAKIQPQVVHAGPDGLGPEMFGVTSLGPSVIPSYLTGRPSEEMTVEQLDRITDQYRAAVRRAVSAGYDGVELHAAHGYMLLGSFLAPQRNRRHDDFTGATVEGRTRAILHVLGAIRDEVGTELPITLRISGYERVAGGRPIDDTPLIAPRLAAAGIDAFHVSGGVIDRLVTRMVNGADDGPGLNVGAAAAVKEVVDVPVIAVGRLHDPELSEQVLADGRADFVAMGRPLLADPELPNKVTRGEVHRVRRCISCQSCIDAMERTFQVECAVEPRTGRETELAIRSAERAKRVVVVGAGPGGMEAARVAALRGHEVLLLEKAGQLGGALVWASALHPENEPLLRWYRRELAASSVQVHLGRAVTADDVAAMAPDAVVVATGGQVVVPDLPGADLPHVHRGAALRELLGGTAAPDASAWQRAGARVLSGVGQQLVRPATVRAATRLWLPFGRRVAIVGGDLVALELAELLAGRGRLVSVFEAGPDLAPEVGLKRRTEHMDRLDRLGVAVHTQAPVDRITDEGVVVCPEGGSSRLVSADDVVLAGRVEADTSLADALAGRVPEVHAVGDCTGLGLIAGATLDGARAATTI